MARVSQATVAEMMRVSSQLGFFDTNFMGDAALVSKTEIRRFLFSRDFDTATINLFEQYDWNFEIILPSIVDGSLGVRKNANWCTRAERISANHDESEQLLRNLAVAFILKANSINQGPYGNLVLLQRLLDSLRNDGFTFSNGKLTEADNEVVDIPAEISAIEKAITEAHHDDKKLLRYHLQEATRQFDKSEWGPATSEWRHFFEEAVRGAWRHTRYHNHNYATRLLKPTFADVLKWLGDSGFFTSDELPAYGASWGFLSVGNHPGLKPESLARLCRSLSMTFGQACLIKLATWDGEAFK